MSWYIVNILIVTTLDQFEMISKYHNMEDIASSLAKCRIHYSHLPLGRFSQLQHNLLINNDFSGHPIKLFILFSLFTVTAAQSDTCFYCTNPEKLVWGRYIHLAVFTMYLKLSITSCTYRMSWREIYFRYLLWHTLKWCCIAVAIVNTTVFFQEQ